MAILNYTTKISPEKTISEIQARLVKNGARQLSFEYDLEENLRWLAFSIFVKDTPIFFKLSPNVEGVLEAMKQAKVTKSLLTMEQATRVAWRIEKDWLEAQLAKIEAGLATPLQLLLPYAVSKSGETFYDTILKGGEKFLLE